MKKMFALLVAMIMALSAVGACAEGTVEFFQQKPEEGPQKAYQAVIEAFEAANPGMSIEMNTVPDAGTVLVQRMSTGDIPVIFSDYPTQIQFQGKVDNEYVLCLDDTDFINNVKSGYLAIAAADDGKQYAMPLSSNFMAVFYNIDIFNECGITELPTTWDELVALCDTLVEKGVTPFVFGDKDPGRVGHCFQAVSIATFPGVVDNLVEVINGEATIADNADAYKKIGERMLTLRQYAMPDSIGTSDTAMWENFANGKAAMCITGSYARGTIKLSNPDVNMGAFAFPGDVYDESPIVSGVDAAVAISAEATEEEQAIALAFLSFLSQPENAQTWSDIDGAPSCLNGTEYSDVNMKPVMDKIATGVVSDWYAGKITSTIYNEIYNVVQQLLMDGDLDAFITNLDETIEEVADM